VRGALLRRDWVILGALLAAALFIRLPRGFAPSVGRHHHRMSQTAAIARNFFQERMNVSTRA